MAERLPLTIAVAVLLGIVVVLALLFIGTPITGCPGFPSASPGLCAIGPDLPPP